MTRKFLSRKTESNIQQPTGSFAPRPFATPQRQPVAPAENSTAPTIQRLPENSDRLSQIDFTQSEPFTPRLRVQRAEQAEVAQENSGIEGEAIQRSSTSKNWLEKVAILPLEPPSTPGFPIQAKLTVGTAGDKYEQEADYVARQVVNRIQAPQVNLNSSESNPVQRKIFIEKTAEPIQAKGGETPNQTGLPDNLKAGVENLSGYSLNDVRVHYNSPKPAQLQALAYTQGTEIHVAPGQEKHLPHEAWHVVQQKQGRVKPTMQMKGGVPVNDDTGLEREADVMGAKAVSVDSAQAKSIESDPIDFKLGVSPIQRKIDYGDPETNIMSEMSIPSGTSLYHATKREHIPKIGAGIDVTASRSTQLGKGFYTSWFSAGMEEYGAYVIRFNLNRDILGQQVFSHKIQEANKEEEANFKIEKTDEAKAVKGNWDDKNDFLYTPKLDEKVDGQNVPHQVKITAQGVNALTDTTVIETGTGKELPISQYSNSPPVLGGLFAAIKNRQPAIKK